MRKFRIQAIASYNSPLRIISWASWRTIIWSVRTFQYIPCPLVLNRGQTRSQVTVQKSCWHNNRVETTSPAKMRIKLACSTWWLHRSDRLAWFSTWRAHVVVKACKRVKAGTSKRSRHSNILNLWRDKLSKKRWASKLDHRHSLRSRPLSISKVITWKLGPATSSSSPLRSW